MCWVKGKIYIYITMSRPRGMSVKGTFSAKGNLQSPRRNSTNSLVSRTPSQRTSINKSPRSKTHGSRSPKRMSISTGNSRTSTSGSTIIKSPKTRPIGDRCKPSTTMGETSKLRWERIVKSAMHAGQSSAIIGRLDPVKHFDWDDRNDPPYKFTSNSSIIVDWIYEEGLLMEIEIVKVNDQVYPTCAVVYAVWPPGREFVRQYTLKSENLLQLWTDEIIQQEKTLYDGKEKWRNLMKTGLITSGQPSVTLMVMHQYIDFDISERSKLVEHEIAPILIPMRPCMEYYTKKEFSPDLMKNVVYHLKSQWRFLVNYITKTEKCIWTLQFDVMPEDTARNYVLSKKTQVDDVITSSPGVAAYFVVMNPLL